MAKKTISISVEEKLKALYDLQCVDSEIDQLIIKKEKLKQEISNDQKLINDLKDPDNYEAFARENFFMKKKDEEIFIIEFKDSIEN